MTSEGREAAHAAWCAADRSAKWPSCGYACSTTWTDEQAGRSATGGDDYEDEWEAWMDSVSGGPLPGRVHPVGQGASLDSKPVYAADSSGRGATWSVVLFDVDDEFELVLDIGTEQDMRRLAAEYPKGDYRAEVALVHRTVKR